jgi:peptidoglycan/LPS O-acetylase OafA/YrhL
MVVARAPWTLPFYSWGLTGVDIFFALSGFLIGRILLKSGSMVVEPKGLLRFWARRWLRTLPAYYVMLLVRLLMAFVIIKLWLHPDWAFWPAVPPYFVFMQSLAWPAPPYFNEAWSLAVEEWFYLLFPLLWMVVIGSGMKPFRAFVLTSVFMLLASTIARLGATTALTPQDWLAKVCGVTVYRFDSIACGLLAAALSVASPQIWARWRWPGLVFGVGLLGLDRHMRILDLIHEQAGYYCTWHCSITGLGSTLLLPWCSSVGKLFWKPMQDLVSLISRWSYSLYLTHGGFIVAAQVIFASQINQSAVWAWSLMAVSVGLSFTLTAVLHRWIEKPGMALRERWKFTRQEQTTLLHGQISA